SGTDPYSVYETPSGTPTIPPAMTDPMMMGISHILDITVSGTSTDALAVSKADINTAIAQLVTDETITQEQADAINGIHVTIDDDDVDTEDPHMEVFFGGAPVDDGLIIQLTGSLTFHEDSKITVKAVNGASEVDLSLALTADSGPEGEGVFRISAEDLG